MEAHEFNTLKKALDILRKRLSGNVSIIKNGVRKDNKIVFSEEVSKLNSFLLNENRENLMLQKQFSIFMNKYLNNLDFKVEQSVESSEFQGVENHMEEAVKSEQAYYQEIIEEKIDLVEGLNNITDLELLNKLMSHFIDKELYEACGLVQEQINESERIAVKVFHNR